ncbi:putative flavoprotein [Mycobacteroides abscessus subsp. abscessus]|nr:putative flavoprotein [Mycobacteroides abscessus]SHX40152.1 putative flavoprotein [Mycobacteroides abscessus subsp. abscessus]
MVSQAISPVIPLDSMRWISFGHRLRFLTTPHIPHNWEAGLWFDETTATLLCATCSPVPGRFRNSPNHIV